MGRQTGPIRTVLDQLAIAAQEASTYGADEEDEDAVTKAVKAWDANLDAALGLKTLEPDARKLLTEVRRLVSHFVVRDPFQALFVAVEELARDVYGEAWPPAELSVAHTKSHPHPGAQTETDPYTVTARTQWPPNPGRPRSRRPRSSWCVYCDEFGPAAFAALPDALDARVCLPCARPAGQGQERQHIRRGFHGLGRVPFPPAMGGSARPGARVGGTVACGSLDGRPNSAQLRWGGGDDGAGGTRQPKSCSPGSRRNATCILMKLARGWPGSPLN